MTNRTVGHHFAVQSNSNSRFFNSFKLRVFIDPCTDIIRVHYFLRWGDAFENIYVSNVFALISLQIAVIPISS